LFYFFSHATIALIATFLPVSPPPPPSPPPLLSSYSRQH
jgi:hypothetical protein